MLVESSRCESHVQDPRFKNSNLMRETLRHRLVQVLHLYPCFSIALRRDPFIAMIIRGLRPGRSYSHGLMFIAVFVLQMHRYAPTERYVAPVLITGRVVKVEGVFVSGHLRHKEKGRYHFDASHTDKTINVL